MKIQVIANPRALRHFLREGGVIAYPTESCYGLGCDPRNARAVQKLLRLKRRPKHKGLLIVAADLPQVQRFIQPPSATQVATLDAHWPGPYTFLFPVSARAPKAVSGRHRSLGIRVSAHPTVAALTAALGPLTSSSANIAGARPAKTAAAAQRVFGGAVRLIPGRIGKRKSPSRIIDLLSGKTLRA